MEEDKHIFIGIGGAGVKTVAQIKYKVYEKLQPTSQKTRLELLDDKYRFLFVDTDNGDINESNNLYKSRFEDGKVSFISEKSELIDLGPHNPHRILRTARLSDEILIDKRIAESWNTNVPLNDITLRQGASAVRIRSRIGFAREIENFQTMLGEKIKSLHKIGGEPTIYYWIVSSSAGGTGSGIINDVLYNVNMLHKTLVKPDNPMVMLVLYTPQIYMDKLMTHNSSENAYAVFSELTAFQTMTRLTEKYMPFHRLALVKDQHQFNPEFKYNPFSFCIPVDYQTDKGTNMGDIDNLYANTAEMLYYVHDGKGATKMRSDLNNLTDNCQASIPDAFLTPMGYIALRKPEKDFEDYMHIRFKYELLKYGLNNGELQPEHEQVDDLYQNKIYSRLTALESYYKQLANSYLINNNFSDEDLIDGTTGKPYNERPSHLNMDEAESVIRAIEKMILEDNIFIKRIEEIQNDLWTWIGEKTLEKGLNYVYETLNQLDNYCATKSKAFHENQNGKKSIRKELIDSIGEIERELPELYDKAEEITWIEKIKKSNSGDIQVYFSKLREYIDAKIKLIIQEQLYKGIDILSEGNQGSIDLMKDQIMRFVHKAGDIEKVAMDSYDKLAKTFIERSKDVTSVYIPNVQKFVDEYGWKENHIFSKWYSQVIKPSHTYVKGKGYIPDPNSIAGILKKLPEICREEMIKEGYWKDQKMDFFSQINKDNYDKVIEDLIIYALRTFDFNLSENTVIKKDWKEKTLPQLFYDLSSSEREEIRSQMDPSLFFTYKDDKVNNVSVMYDLYIAADKKEATEILGYTDNSNNASFKSDPSVISIIRAKVGLSFDFYRIYDTMRAKYAASIQKELFHFHTAFAYSNGDYMNINLPEEAEPQMITFMRYVLMNEYKDLLKNNYYSSNKDFDKDHYTSTPFIREEKRIQIASKANVTTKDDRSCLQKNDGIKDLFVSLFFTNPDRPLASAYDEFKTKYIENGFSQAIESLIKDQKWKKDAEMRMNYNDVKSKIISEFTQYLHASRENNQEKESAVLLKMLSILTNELDTFDKFIK